MADKKTQTPTLPLLEYLAWRGDLTFLADPFNEVDNLILCTISYLNFSRFPEVAAKEPNQGVLLRTLAQKMDERDDQLGLSEHSYLPVLRAAAKSTRFRSVRLFGYVSELDVAKTSQFQAVSFLLPNEMLFIAFMGTDTSLAGWKEDFNMSYLEAVPAQLRAQQYATEMSAICPERKLLIGGHSKGGNLAVWATVHLPDAVIEQQWIQTFNNDGPGFSRSFLDSSAYKRVENRILTFIPEESIVGVLLEHEEDYFVVASTYHGMMQHDIISWKCIGSRMAYLNRRNKLGKASDKVLHQWIGSMTIQEREEFSNALFDVLSANGKYQTVQEVMRGGISSAWDMVRCFSGIGPEKRKLMLNIFHRLGVDIKDEMRKNIRKTRNDKNEK